MVAMHAPLVRARGGEQPLVGPRRVHGPGRRSRSIFGCFDTCKHEVRMTKGTWTAKQPCPARILVHGAKVIHPC